MATEYIAATTLPETGVAFTLSSGSSRTFSCDSPLKGNEVLNLSILGSDGGYQPAGVLAHAGKLAGVVTAQGEGDSSFKVAKSATTESVRVDYD